MEGESVSDLFDIQYIYIYQIDHYHFVAFNYRIFYNIYMNINIL